jgi:uncharacterized protein YdaU (DUF1376 family)
MYPKDFLGDVNTITMTAEEFGAYSLLILHAWEQGAELRYDLDELSALARVKRPKFDKMWEQKLSRCFTVARSKRTISNPRQRREAVKQRRYSASQSTKARQRWDNDDAAAVPGDSRGSAAGMPPTPTPTPPSSLDVRTSEDLSRVRCNRCPTDGEHWGLLYAGTKDQTTCRCKRGKARKKWYAQKCDREEQDAGRSRGKRGDGPTRIGPGDVA